MTTTEPAWADLLARWDAQQDLYIGGRERGFDAMLSVLDALVPGELVALDLAAGPGSLSSRLLDRRPDARCLAVDVDPVLQTVGRGALGDVGGRLEWVRADLRDPDWVERLPERSVDAVLTSTALHWLAPEALAALYRTLASLVRPGGVLLNFDGFPLPEPAPRWAAAAKAVERTKQERGLAAGVEAWQDWWDAVRAEPALREAFAERDRVFAAPSGRIFSGADRAGGTTVEYHAEALREAGFVEVDTVWQDFHRRILLAVR